MPKTSRAGLKGAGELPGTLQRSSTEARETFIQAHEHAVESCGPGDQADRQAYAELKRTFEKRGDHWIAKEQSA